MRSLLDPELPPADLDRKPGLFARVARRFLGRGNHFVEDDPNDPALQSARTDPADPNDLDRDLDGEVPGYQRCATSHDLGNVQVAIFFKESHELFLRLMGLNRAQVAKALDKPRLARAAEKFRAQLNDLSGLAGDFNNLVPVECDEQPAVEWKLNLEPRFFSIVQQYLSLFPHITGASAPRDPSKLFAWVEQSYKAVYPKFHSQMNPEEARQKKELFQFFVKVVVLFVILFDDITEEKRVPELLAVVDRLRAIRLKNKQVALSQIEGFSDLTPSQQGYVATIDASFDLLYDTIEALCPQEGLDNEGQVQVAAIRQLMQGALRELFEQMDFGMKLSELIQGSRQSFETMVQKGGKPVTVKVDRNILGRSKFIDSYVEKGAPKMQMRLMLLGAYLQWWGGARADQKAPKKFYGRLASINALGRAIEKAGFHGNEFGSLPREMAQKDIANVVLLKALQEDSISFNRMQEALEAFDDLGQERSVIFMSQVAMFVITGEREDIPDIDHFPQVVVDLIIAIFKEDGPFAAAVGRWKEVYLRLKNEFSGSNLSEIMNLDAFIREQHRFMVQYAMASPFI